MRLGAITGDGGPTEVNPMKLPYARKGDLEPVEGRFETMVLALAVWLCTLPLVGLLVLPFFGLKAASLIALGLLFVALTACWLICIWSRNRIIGASGERPDDFGRVPLDTVIEHGFVYRNAGKAAPDRMIPIRQRR